MKYGMVSLMTSSHDKLWRAFFLNQPTAEVWLHGEVDTFDSWPSKESDCCDCDSCDSHVKRVLTILAALHEVQGEVPSVEEGRDVDPETGDSVFSQSRATESERVRERERE